MRWTPAEVRAVVATAERLPFLAVPDRVHNLAARLEADPGSVAVVGMVKRGKSTLINRLVGTSVTGVSATPETAAIIHIRTGTPESWGLKRDGTLVELAADPESFCRQVRRLEGNTIVRAGIRGLFRLPADLTLVDTPGIGDVAAEEGDGYHGLDLQWAASGAGAALVVLSWPPGTAASDRALVDHANRVFGGSVAVAIKSRSTAVGSSDLVEAAEAAAAILETEVHVVPDVESAGRWGGAGPLGSIERLLGSLSEQAKLRLGADVVYFEKYLDDLLKEIDRATLADLAPLAAALEAAPDATPSYLVARVEGTGSRLMDEQDRAEQARADEAHRRELAVFDASATRLIDIARRTGGAPADRAQTELEILELARRGSPIATDEVCRILCTPRDRARFALDELVGLLPVARGPDVVGSMPGSAADFEDILRSKSIGDEVRLVAEKRAVETAEREGDAEMLVRLMSSLTDGEVRVKALIAEGGVRSARLHHSALNGSADHRRWDVLADRAEKIDEWLARCQFQVALDSGPQRKATARSRDPGGVMSVEAKARKVEALRQQDLAQFASDVRPEIEAGLVQLFRQPVLDVDAWRSWSGVLLQRGSWVASMLPAGPQRDELALMVERTASAGDAWARDSQAAVARAHASLAGWEGGWDVAYFASYVGWVLAFFALFVRAELGFWIWLLSFLVWVAALVMRRIDRPWESFYTAPRSPLLPPAPVLTARPPPPAPSATDR